MSDCQVCPYHKALSESSIPMGSRRADTLDHTAQGMTKVSMNCPLCSNYSEHRSAKRESPASLNIMQVDGLCVNTSSMSIPRCSLTLRRQDSRSFKDLCRLAADVLVRRDRELERGFDRSMNWLFHRLGFSTDQIRFDIATGQLIIHNRLRGIQPAYLTTAERKEVCRREAAQRRDLAASAPAARGKDRPSYKYWTSDKTNFVNDDDNQVRLSGVVVSATPAARRQPATELKNACRVNVVQQKECQSNRSPKPAGRRSPDNLSRSRYEVLNDTTTSNREQPRLTHREHRSHIPEPTKSRRADRTPGSEDDESTSPSQFLAPTHPESVTRRVTYPYRPENRAVTPEPTPRPNAANTYRLEESESANPRPCSQFLPPDRLEPVARRIISAYRPENRVVTPEPTTNRRASNAYRQERNESVSPRPMSRFDPMAQGMSRLEELLRVREIAAREAENLAPESEEDDD